MPGHGARGIVRVNEADLGPVESLALVSSEPVPDWLGKDDEVWVTREGSAFSLHGEGGSLSVEPRERTSVPDLDVLCGGVGGALLWVGSLRRQGGSKRPPTVFVHYVRTGPERRHEEDLVIEFGDIAADDLQRFSGLRLGQTEALREFLRSQLLIDPHPKTNRRDAPEVLGETTSGPSVNVRMLASAGPEGREEHAFTIHGREFAVDVARSDGGIWQITRVVGHRSGDDPRFILTGPVEIADSTAAQALRGLGDLALSDYLETEGTQAFLSLWDEYHRRDREESIRQVRDLGSFQYDSVGRRGDGTWRFDLERSADALRRHIGDALVATERQPDFDQSEQLDRTSFIGRIEAVQHDPPVLEMKDDGRGRRPPSRGYLSLSLAAQTTRLSRQERARAKLVSQSGPMPQIGRLIEGREVPIREARRIEPLSAKASERLGGNPTPRQREALDVALNTPDVALIQGPPGTGKTAVIAALQSRLSEVSELTGPAIGTTLLSSFQHDAVEHVVSKTDALGLPGLKVGRRYGSGEGDELPAVNAWIRRVARGIRDEFHPGEVYLAHRKAAALFARSLRSSTRPERVELFREGSQLAEGTLSERMLAESRRLEEVEVSAGPQDDLRRNRFSKTLAELGDPSSPMDARLTAAMRCAKYLASEGHGSSEALEELSNWVDDSDPPDELFSVALAQCEHFLDDDEQVEGEDADVLEDRQLAMFAELHAQTKRDLDRSAEGVEQVALRFADRIESDPEGCRQFAARYSGVLGATCQQAASSDMTRIMGESRTFENVIVDEAARANPLDLMIPMAMGSRRVILVGDHRQLPQMLEPDVERSVRESIGDEAAERLKQSLFERMFVQLRELESDTGVRRVVTLDTQFRMHPRLGAYVGATYYSQDGGLVSPDSTQLLDHSIGGYAGRVAVWEDVPANSGREQRRGTGKARPSEADKAAELVASLDREAPEHSIGVITFYAAQRDLICQALESRHLMERRPDGGWVSTRRTSGGAAELRVGSVDQFQGTEFDIVVLSIVRCNDIICDSAELQRRKWGFLTLPNRMCVATSRQRRLLLVVGDAAMAEGAAEKWAPELASLRSLCLEEAERGA